MSSEVHKYIEEALKKNESLFNAEVISFPNEKKIKGTENSKFKSLNTWKLYDKTNVNEDGDQLKAVIGICSMIGSLVLMGLYSNFL